MGTLICHMEELGWTMTNVDIWMSPPDQDGHREGWSYVRGSDPTDLMDTVHNQVIDRLWQEASLHRNSQGMYEDGVGPDITGFRKHYHYLIKQGRHSDAGILMAIGTGALWTNARTSESYPEQDPACPHCNHPTQSEVHMFWGCIDTNSQDIPAISKTKQLSLIHI